MKNLKISMKLFIGFGVVLVMLLINIIFGTVSLNSIGKNFREFYSKPFDNVKEVLQADREAKPRQSICSALAWRRIAAW